MPFLKLLKKRLLQGVAFVFIYFTFFFRGTFTVIAILLILYLVPTYLKAETTYPDKWEAPYPLLSSNMELHSALELFSKNYRVGLIIDRDTPNEKIRKVTEVLSGVSYLDSLAANSGLNWYFDGSILRVFPVGKQETRVIPLKASHAFKVIQSLKELGIYQPKFTHKAGERAQTLRVTAPKEYLDIVSRTVEAIELSRQVDVRIRRAGVVVDYQDIPNTLSVDEGAKKVGG